MPDRDRLRRLHDVSAAVARLLDVDTAAREIVRAAVSLGVADAASLMLERDGDLRIAAQEGLSETYAAAQRIPIERYRARYRGFDAHEDVDLRAGAIGDPELVRQEGLARVLSVPIVIDEEPVGSLNAYARDPARRFDDDDIDVAHILAQQAAVTIRNARLYAQAVEASREKDDFLSLVSHELKTPLTPLKALAQLLRTRMRRAREQGRELDLESFERNLAVIERQVDRMNGIVNDLLEVSRAGRGRFELVFDEVDLVPLVRGVVQRYVVAGAEDARHRFSVEVPDSLVVRGDQARLEQVLMNLVGNAVKYSPRGGDVTIAARAEGDHAAVEVRDTGIGIPAADLATIGREPFVRGTGRAATYSGIGIGLYISRLVAEGHGGALEIESQGDDRGTTVRIRIPVAA